MLLFSKLSFIIGLFLNYKLNWYVTSDSYYTFNKYIIKNFCKIYFLIK